MWIVRLVFRCFKCIERSADRITGAVGPLFILIAVVLLAVGIFTFFDVIAPELRLRFISTPLCALMALNMVANYYWSITVPPGFPDESVGMSGQRRYAPDGRWSKWIMAPVQRPLYADLVDDDGLIPAKIGKCQKCGSVKPERAHHCRICKRCVTKMDHHCPWINQCVGINNERFFVLFMVYLVVCCACFLWLGFPRAYDAFVLVYEWPYRTPQIVFMLIYIIAFAIGLAVSAMCLWHLWLISQGQSSIENHDVSAYRKMAASRGQQFINAYDLGWKRNFALFFNITPTGHPWWVLLLPLRTLPYTDGFSWIRRHGYEHGHGGIRDFEEFTDVDEDD